MSNKDPNQNPEKLEQDKKKQSGTQFNSGNNDSDYDGGHPGSSFEGQEESPEESDGHGTFNAGHNDSDYDGGHPGESFPSKK